jgi:hypothetical protein
MVVPADLTKALAGAGEDLVDPTGVDVAEASAYWQDPMPIWSGHGNALHTAALSFELSAPCALLTI